MPERTKAEKAFLTRLNILMNKFKVTLAKYDYYSSDEVYGGTDYYFKSYHKNMNIDIPINEDIEE